MEHGRVFICPLNDYPDVTLSTRADMILFPKTENQWKGI